MAYIGADILFRGPEIACRILVALVTEVGSLNEIMDLAVVDQL